MVTTYWSPNQAYIAQVETYTFTCSTTVTTFSATINGKSVSYTSTISDTATTVATALYGLLSSTTNIPAELTEITFTNPSAGVLVATANTAGTPFANITGVTGGLVLNASGGTGSVTTAHTTPNASPSDVYDPQNWMRNGVRALPQNGDAMIVSNSSVPLLWNLSQLATVQLGSYQRWQDFTGTIGLPEINANGYVEWRTTYFQFAGPTGSVPAGGLQMVLGYNPGSGSGPTRERYNTGSQSTALTILAAGSSADQWGVRFLGTNNDNTFTLLGGVSLGIGMLAGEVAGLSTSTVVNGTLGIGVGVQWNTTSGSVLTMQGGTAILNSAPSTLVLNNGASATIATDGLTWQTITAQNGSTLTLLAGGIVTNLTLRTSSSLDKSQDGRALIITNSTLDGDTCSINDPNNCITFTNATVVTQQVTSGPIQFTGPRTMKVT